jgi:hypothetical protein
VSTQTTDPDRTVPLPFDHIGIITPDFAPYYAFAAALGAELDGPTGSPSTERRSSSSSFPAVAAWRSSARSTPPLHRPPACTISRCASTTSTGRGKR